MIASTYYAFGSWPLVATRIGLSVIVALSVGLSMLVASPRALRADGAFHDGDACGCAGGCAMPDRSFFGVRGATGQSFGRILPYLLGGVGVDAGSSAMAGVFSARGASRARSTGPDDGCRLCIVSVFFF